MHHELKIKTPYYLAVASGDKTFEIRYNDRGYQKGDTVDLIEVYPETDTYVSSSKPIMVQITYVTNFKQMQDWVVFGFKKISPLQSGVTND